MISIQSPATNTYGDYQIYRADLVAGAVFNNIGDLVNTAIENNDAIESIETPDLSFTAQLDKLWFVLNNENASQYAIIVDLTAGQQVNLIDTSQMGAIGDLVTVEVDVDANRIVYSHGLDPDTSDGTINNIFGTDDGVPQLDWPQGFTSGLMGDFKLGFDGTDHPFSLFFNFPEEDDDDDDETEGDDSDTKGGGQTVSVQKRTPSFSLDSIDVSFKQLVLDVVIDASVQMGPLTGKLIQFEVQLDFSDLQNPAIGIDLKGIGIGYDSPPISLAGALIKDGDEISGGLALGLTEWSMTALGSVAMVELPEGGGSIPSVFLYGYLGGELVNIEGIVSLNGIAATMGFNRALKPPQDLSKLGDHPFIKAASSTPEHPTTLDELTEEVESLNEYVPPSLGGFFFGIGLKGELVELISLYLLPVIDIDLDLSSPTPSVQDVNVQVYGIGSLGLPVDEPFLELDVALVGAFSPLQGDVLIGASLTDNSGITLLKDNKLKLTGGAAFYLSKEQKTFVLTVGGYGPKLRRNASWPQVDPIKLSWKPTDDINIDAKFYFALVPSAMALGFSMDADATYDLTVASGGFSAHFGLDALIQWKPFHFEADLNASFSAYVTTAFGQNNFDIQADLTLWGQKATATKKEPDPHHLTIGGKASLRIHAFVPFTVKAKFGTPKTSPPVVSLSDFAGNFLPKDANDQLTLASLKINQGQTNVAGIHPAKDVIVITPGLLEMQVEGFLPPSKGITFMGSAPIADSRADQVGIQMAGFTASNYHNELYAGLDVTIQQLGNDAAMRMREENGLSDNFSYQLLTRDLPAALWKPAAEEGIASKPSPNSSPTVKKVPIGLTISVNTPEAGEKITFEKSLFEFDVFMGDDIRLNPQNDITLGEKSTLTEAASQMAGNLPDTELLTALGFTDLAFGTLAETDLMGEISLTA